MSAVEADGGVREGGDVVEVTGLLARDSVKRWPTGMQVIVRRERPHPGAQLSLFEENDGYRYQAFVTSTKVGQIAHLEARHRAHARVEDHIRHAKDTGLRRFPSRDFTINQAWLGCVMLAAHLVAWTRLLALHGDATELRSCEPKALRYRLWHVPARLTRGARQRQLRIPKTWLWDHRDRRSLREHRRDPRTHLTRPPTTPPPEGRRRTAPRQRQPAPHHTPNQNHNPTPSRCRASGFLAGRL